MMNLMNKNILFFAPAFFGYEQKIAEKMKQLGASVDFYDERSVTNAYERALLKIAPGIFSKKTTKYYDRIINEINKKEYDYIFVIKCEMLSVKIIKKLRKINPKALFCLYLYDSLENIKGIIPKLNEFDRVLSFDSEDTKQYDNIKFRPLFYIDSFCCELKKTSKYKYDVSFIGTIHSDRYKIIKMIKQFIKDNDFNYFFYCYLQRKFIYYYYKITKKEFQSTKINDFSFDKIQSYQIANIISETKIVLDIQHPKQTGLTMRTIEMLGMNKKLITTNKNIKEYDFYNSDNILVIDRKNIEITTEFLNSSYKKIDDEIYKNYSLENWIFDVLGLERKRYDK